VPTPSTPTDDQLRRFIDDCNARRLGRDLFQKSTRRSAQRMLRGTPERPTAS
jgi:hypothetical protein